MFRIDGKDYKMSFNGLCLVVYKEQFGKNVFTLIDNLGTVLTEDPTALFELEYAMIKSTGNDIGDYKDWLASVESMGDLLDQDNIKYLIEAVNVGIKTSKKAVSKKKEQQD